jgi:hypothetical protein
MALLLTFLSLLVIAIIVCGVISLIVKDKSYVLIPISVGGGILGIVAFCWLVYGLTMFWSSMLQ